jgi:hypothetical protein
MFEAASKRCNKSHACFIRKILLWAFYWLLGTSVFHSINDNSNDFGYSSKQDSSSTKDTSDSDWQQTEEKSTSTRSVDTASDTSFSTYQNGLTSVYDAKHHSRPKPNYTSNFPSQDSDYQEQIRQNGDECQEQPTKDGSEENSEYEDSVCQGVPLVKGQFCFPMVVFFPLFEKKIHVLMHRSWRQSRLVFPK